MKVLEIIRLLAPRDRIRMVLEDLRSVIRDLDEAVNDETITAYSRDAFDSDLMICIRWNRGEKPGKSRVGHLLAEHLTNFGLVHHEVWKQELPACEGQEKEESSNNTGNRTAGLDNLLNLLQQGADSLVD